MSDDRFDIPGPAHHEGISHGLEYDHDTLRVELWGKVGDKGQFCLKTRSRPMSTSEMIWSKTREFTRAEVLSAYGVVETDTAEPLPPRKRKWWFW